MARKRINQEVYYKSFRYTSNHNLLNEFFQEKDINFNRMILNLVLNSPEFKTYKQRIVDETNFYSSYAFFDC